MAEALARNLEFFGAQVGGRIDIAQELEGAELFEASSLNKLTIPVEGRIKSGFARPTGASGIIRSRYPKAIAGWHLEIYREVTQG